MKTTFKLVGGTDVNPALLESGQPKRKRGSSKRDGRGRRANPLRATFTPISPAVTVFGKMNMFPGLCPGVREMWLEKLRAGAAGARIVAIELDRAAEHLLQERDQ